MVGERGTTLSGGQRQRIALARAVVRTPRLLVLDDATSAVDPTVEAAILAGLRAPGEHSATVVVVAYRKATIALADEVAYLEHGRIVDRGPHAELFAAQRGLPHAGRRLRARGGRARRRRRRRGRPGMTVDDRDGPDRSPPGTSATAGPAPSGRPSAAGSSCRPRSSAAARSRWPSAWSRRWAGSSCRSPSSRPSTPASRPTAVPTYAGWPSSSPAPRSPSCVTAVTAYVVNVRLFRATEAGLMSLRVKAFRHVHDLSVLTQNAERRGSMVSRVTSDVDTISQFVQFGGLQLLLSVGQLLVATVLMAIYSPLLTVLVWLCFAPMLVGRAVLPAQGVRGVPAGPRAGRRPARRGVRGRRRRGDRPGLRDRAAHPGAGRRGGPGPPARGDLRPDPGRPDLQPGRAAARA